MLHVASVCSCYSSKTAFQMKQYALNANSATEGHSVTDPPEAAKLSSLDDQLEKTGHLAQFPPGVPMTITVDAQTQLLIEEAMKQRGIGSPEEVIQCAVQMMQEQVLNYDDLDEETRAAIDEADSQEGIAWENIKDDLLKLYGGK